LDNIFFAESLIRWYSVNKRNLPWRSTNDPYKIWLSEVILQQTRVEQGLPYYEKFIHKYPNIKTLALADIQDVLKLWEGLGYYSRAKNLHRCANKVVDSHNGIFPNSYNALLTLPGIGPYSAAAIASFAFKEAAAVLDGNVYRVISRVFGVKDDISHSRTAKKFTLLANELLDTSQPDNYNQAIMEFGALHCKPHNPLCENCTLADMCYAFEHNAQQQLPVKSKKVKVSTKHFSYIVFVKENRIAMKKRNDSGIWKGLYDFHLISSAQKMDEESALASLNLDSSKMLVEDISKEYKHILTHQRIYATFYKIKLQDETLMEDTSLTYYNIDEVHNLPKPVLISKYLNENIF